MYIILFNLHCKQFLSSPWIICGSKLFQNNSNNCIWITQYFNTDTKFVYKCECDKFKQLWCSKLINKINNINVMYNLFKYSHKIERYTLFQFRIGTYTLPVSNQRNFTISRNKIICQICDEAVIRDEINFL